MCSLMLAWLPNAHLCLESLSPEFLPLSQSPQRANTQSAAQVREKQWASFAERHKPSEVPKCPCALYRLGTKLPTLSPFLSTTLITPIFSSASYLQLLGQPGVLLHESACILVPILLTLNFFLEVLRQRAHCWRKPWKFILSWGFLSTCLTPSVLHVVTLLTS